MTFFCPNHPIKKYVIVHRSASLLSKDYFLMGKAYFVILFFFHSSQGCLWLSGVSYFHRCTPMSIEIIPLLSKRCSILCSVRYFNDTLYLYALCFQTPTVKKLCCFIHHAGHFYQEVSALCLNRHDHTGMIYNYFFHSIQFVTYY